MMPSLSFFRKRNIDYSLVAGGQNGVDKGDEMPSVASDPRGSSPARERSKGDYLGCAVLCKRTYFWLLRVVVTLLALALGIATIFLVGLQYNGLSVYGIRAALQENSYGFFVPGKAEGPIPPEELQAYAPPRDGSDGGQNTNPASISGGGGSSVTEDEAFCRGCGSHLGSCSSSPRSDLCLPTFQDMTQRYDWPLAGLWAHIRWRFHFPEYVRKLITFFFPIDRRLVHSYRREVAAMLSFFPPYIEIPPIVPPNPKCTPPESYTIVPEEFARKSGGQPGSAQKSISLKDYCENARKVHHGFFTGQGKEREAKIVDTVILGFDLDVLEMRFYELNEAVDYFVVVESSYHTVSFFRKPLLFRQNMERFKPFLHKTLVFTAPDEMVAPFTAFCRERYNAYKDNCFRFEFHMRDFALYMFSRFNEGLDSYGNDHVKAPLIGPDDYVMTSDPDEIVMGDRLRHMRFCQEPNQGQHSWGIAMYSGTLKKFSKQDFEHLAGSPVPYPYALGPVGTTLKYRRIRDFARAPFVTNGFHYLDYRGRSEFQPPLYMWGGWHMSDYTYLPFILAKIPVDDVKPGYEPWSAFEGIVHGNVALAQTSLWQKSRDYLQVGHTLVDLDKVDEKYRHIGLGSIPWFLKCNPRRFPAWFGEMDGRYFIQPNKSLYVDGQPFTARTAKEWSATLEKVKGPY